MERTAERFFLQRGQILRLHADQAASIVVTRGRLLVAQRPQWLGEPFAAPCIALAEGQAHAVDGGGWISLTALGQAEILAFPKRRGLPAWLDFPGYLAAALGGWRRRLASRRA